jgi:phosphoribosylformylglycinamidine cyclo-ligase
MAHISGGGLLNITRLAANVSYEFDSLPEAPEIFGLIASAGDVDAAIMYATFNMGIGFCVVVGQEDLQAALGALKDAGEDATRIGTVTAEPGRTVAIPSAGLKGKGDTFERTR